MSRLGEVNRYAPVLSAKARFHASTVSRSLGLSSSQEKEVGDKIIASSVDSFFPPSPEESAILNLKEQRAGTLPPTTATVQAMIDGMNRAASSDVEGVQVADHGGFPALEVNVTNLNGNGEPGMEAIEPTTWQGTTPQPGIHPGYVPNPYNSNNKNFISPDRKHRLAPVSTVSNQEQRAFFESVENAAGDLEAAVPDPTNSNSGITVSTGLDLGQHDADSLSRMGIHQDIISKLTPYFGYNQESVIKAQDFLRDNPLALTQEEYNHIADQLSSFEDIEIEKRWDSGNLGFNSGYTPEVGHTKWRDLTQAQRTVVQSVLRQYGINTVKTPKFLTFSHSGDWDSVITELENFQDEYDTRRGKEANLLKEERQNNLSLKQYTGAVLATAQNPIVMPTGLEERAGREFNAIHTSIEQEFAVNSMVQAMLNGMENAASSNVEGVQVAGPVPPGVIEDFRQKMDPIPEQNREAVLRAAMFSALNPPPTPEDVVAYIQEPYKGGGPMHTGGVDAVNINRPIGTGIPTHVVQQMDGTDVWDNPIISDFNAMRTAQSRPQSTAIGDLNFSSILSESVMERFPAIVNLKVIDSRGIGVTDGRKLEFYHPNGDSPLGDVPVVEVFSDEFNDEELVRLISADYMHYLPTVSEEFNEIRERMRSSMTPEQKGINERAYQLALDDGETRPFDRWFDLHRLDQFMGSGMLPDGEIRDGWMNMLSSEQKDIIQEAENFLINGTIDSSIEDRNTRPGAPHTGGNVDFGLETVGLENTFTGLRRDGGGREFKPGVQEFIDDISAFLGDVGDSISDLANTPFQEGSTIEGVIAAADRPGLIEDDEGTATVNFFGKLGTFPIPTPSATMARNKARVNAIARQINIQRWDEMSSRDTTFGRPLPVEIKAAAAAGMFEHTFGMNIDRFQDREGNITGDMMERINPANPSEQVDVTTFVSNPDHASVLNYSENTDAFIADAVASADGDEVLKDLEWMETPREALKLMSREDFLAYTSAAYGTSEAYRLDQELALNYRGYVPRPWYGEEKPSETFWNMWAFFIGDGATLTDSEQANDDMGPLRLVLRALERQKGQGGGFGNR